MQTTPPGPQTISSKLAALSIMGIASALMPSLKHFDKHLSQTPMRSGHPGSKRSSRESNRKKKIAKLSRRANRHY